MVEETKNEVIDTDRYARYSEHTKLKKDLESTQAMVKENRSMIQNNHIEVMKMISDMSNSHSDDLQRLSTTMGETNAKLGDLNETVARTNRIFKWWDDLPCKRRMTAKILSAVGAVMAWFMIVINFIEKVTGY